MDQDTYNRKWMNCLLKSKEEQLNSIFEMAGDLFIEDLRTIPVELRVSFYHSLLLTIYVNAIGTSLALVKEDSFEESMEDVINVMREACPKIRERYIEMCAAENSMDH